MKTPVKRRRFGIAASMAAACGLTIGAIPGSAFAGLCAFTTDCTLTLSAGNTGSGFGTGNFGTVHLGLNTATHIATVTVDLADGFFIIDTGFPGSFGFVDALGGGLTIGSFSSAAYSGSISDATNDGNTGLLAASGGRYPSCTRAGELGFVEHSTHRAGVNQAASGTRTN